MAVAIFEKTKISQTKLDVIYDFITHLWAKVLRFMFAMPPDSNSVLTDLTIYSSFHYNEIKDKPFISCPSLDVCDGRSLNMKREEDRLKTFEKWPLSFIDPARLAKEGFFYMKIDDRVKCEFCKVEIGRWEEGDNPSTDHQRWAPNCPFLRKRNVGNIPLGESEGTLVTSDQSNDICGPHITIRSNAVCESTEARSSQASIVKTPKYPAYATSASRLKSFSAWPNSVRQRPAELADAGFFYTGQGDRVSCYHCGLGLKDWTETDIPWEQHTLWYPNCKYVQLLKGKEFVNTVTMSVSPQPVVFEDLQTKPSVSLEKRLNSERNPQPTSSKSVDIKAVPDDKLCKICYIEEKNAVFVPCGHVIACMKCSLSVKECPVCRQPHSDVMRVFFS